MVKSTGAIFSLLLSQSNGFALTLYQQLTQNSESLHSFEAKQ